MLLENHQYPFDDRVRREATTLVGAGYEVSVISPKKNGQRFAETISGVHVYRYPEAPEIGGAAGHLLEYAHATVITAILSLLVLARRGFDVIHAHNPPDTFVVIAAFYKMFGKKFVFDHHDLSPEMYRARLRGNGSAFLHRALIVFEKLSCRLADHVISTNESYKAMAMKRSGVPESRITIVRNGPDLARLVAVDPDLELVARGQTIIGYVGVMGFQDGIDYLIRALHHLKTTLGRTDFYCVLVGKGDAWYELKSLTAQLGLSEHVKFTGRIPDADFIRYLSSTDICVDPDPYNPFNDRSTMIKMMEYMALSKPIVAFDLTENRFTAQSAALYAKPNDELEFAKAIEQLMDDPERRRVMGEFGRQRIETQLEWRHNAPKLLQAYDSLRTSETRIKRPVAS